MTATTKPHFYSVSEMREMHTGPFFSRNCKSFHGDTKYYVWKNHLIVHQRQRLSNDDICVSFPVYLFNPKDGSLRWKCPADSVEEARIKIDVTADQA
jgi:hypothetical protein